VKLTVTLTDSVSKAYDLDWGPCDYNVYMSKSAPSNHVDIIEYYQMSDDSSEFMSIKAWLESVDQCGDDDERRKVILPIILEEYKRFFGEDYKE
jgi:hypothetical protein